MSKRVYRFPHFHNRPVSLKVHCTHHLARALAQVTHINCIGISTHTGRHTLVIHQLPQFLLTSFVPHLPLANLIPHCGLINTRWPMQLFVLCFSELLFAIVSCQSLFATLTPTKFMFSVYPWKAATH
ncbi:hypothetical protein ACTXT7_007602 [Hymenolepis weldensis]